MHLFFIFVASIDSVINLRVRLEDVHCVFFRDGILTINECQKRSVRGKQKVQF